MNLKQLEVFVAVAENGSFSRGAELSYITQSTVSQHVAALEQEFGLRLLDRTGKGARLTEGGKILLERARRVLGEIKEMRRQMDRFKGLEDVQLTVGASNVPGNYLIPAALPMIAARHPGLHMTVLLGDSREILEKIEREEVEVAVIGTWFDTEGITFAPLGADDLCLVTAGNHPWSRGSVVTREMLLSEPFVLREGGSGTGKTVEEGLRVAGIELRHLTVKAWLGSNEAVKQAVAGGLGVSFISRVSVQREVERGDLATVPVEGVTISRQFYLLTRTGRELSPAGSAFAAIMSATG